MNFSILTAILAFVSNAVHCYQTHPYYEEISDNNLYSQTDGQNGPHHRSSFEQMNPIINFFGNAGDKKVYSVFMPIERKDGNDLMASESVNRPSVVDITRRAGPKGTKKFNKQLGNQLSNGFNTFGETFGQTFGEEFAKNFNNLAKHRKRPKSRPFLNSWAIGPAFFGKRSNFGRFKNFLVKYF